MEHRNTTQDDALFRLHIAGKRTTMRHKKTMGVDFMRVQRRAIHPEEGKGSIFDDADSMMRLVVDSFEAAATEAVAENDRCGIPTHGAVGGKLVTRIPPKISTLDNKL